MTRKQFWALTAVIISSGVAILDGSIVNLALPAIARDFHASFVTQQWIVDGYLLSLSALILLGGTLGDLFGRKKVYLIGLVGFGVSSLFCALSPAAGVLIALRLVQGVFGALLIPGALAIINTNFEGSQRGLAFGRWTAWSAVLTALGPLVGGTIIDAVSWRWIFLINIPLIIVSYFLAVPSIVESRDERPRKLDAVGAGLAMVALGGIIYGLIEGPATHWSGVTLGALLLGVVFAVIFIYNQSRASDPMLNLELFTSRNFNGANLATFAMYGALGGFFFILVIYLQTTVGFSAFAAGASLLPVTVCMVLLASQAGKLSAKYGPRMFMTVGPILSGLGILLLFSLHHGSTYWLGVLPGITLFALGLATTVAPLTTTVMTSVKQASSGIASAVNNAVARAAGLIIVAVLGLLGSGQAYHFGVILCSALAIGAGIISYLIVQNPSHPANG
jgi:EmrB/QacA subfamily drug resistance transporter